MSVNCLGLQGSDEAGEGGRVHTEDYFGVGLLIYAGCVNNSFINAEIHLIVHFAFSQTLKLLSSLLMDLVSVLVWVCGFGFFCCFIFNLFVFNN